MNPSLTDDAIEIVQDGRPVGFFTSSTLPLATKSKVGGGGAPFSDDFMMSGAMALDWAKKSRPDGTETLADETRYVLDSLERTYALMGGTLRDIVRMTVFVQDIEYGSEIVATIAERYAGGPAPKVLLIEASVAYDCRLELETLALRPSENPGPAAVAPPVMLGVSASGNASGAALPNFVFASATSAPRGEETLSTQDLEEDVRYALDRIDATLGDAQLSVRDVAKVLPWTNVEELRFPFIDAYTPLMSPAPFPGRALVAATRADAFGGSVVSIEATVIR
jgi:enamine deaminase RidA (YjgF/YER057c/UK114 family)